MTNMTTFKQNASNCFFDDDDHTDTLHIDKKIQQGKRYETTGELDLEKAKEIDCEMEKVKKETRIQHAISDDESFKNADIRVLESMDKFVLMYRRQRAIKISYSSKSHIVREKMLIEIRNIDRVLRTKELVKKCGGGI